VENLRIEKTVSSENRPSFNDWCIELKVSSGYFVVGQRDVKLQQTFKGKKVGVYEKIKSILGIW
jgi:hypothetical protein